MKEVPIIDISKNVSVLVNEECEKWRFFLADGHGISENLINNMFKSSYDFFDLTEDEKRKYNIT